MQLASMARVTSHSPPLLVGSQEPLSLRSLRTGRRLVAYDSATLGANQAFYAVSRQSDGGGGIQQGKQVDEEGSCNRTLEVEHELEQLFDGCSCHAYVDGTVHVITGVQI